MKSVLRPDGPLAEWNVLAPVTHPVVTIVAFAGRGDAMSATVPNARAEAPSRSAFRTADFLAIGGIKQSPASRYDKFMRERLQTLGPVPLNST